MSVAAEGGGLEVGGGRGSDWKMGGECLRRSGGGIVLKIGGKV